MTHSMLSELTEVRRSIFKAKEHLFSPLSIKSIKGEWRPFASVIIPFHDSHLWWNFTENSILSQSFEDFEVIVVNDGSSHPNSLDIIRRLENSSPPNWRVISHFRSQGVAAARNTGALEARGDFLLFLDADDLLSPTALEKLSLSFLFLAEDQQNSVAFIYSGVEHFGAFEATSFDPWDKELLLQKNFLPVTALLRRSVYLKSGGMDPLWDGWEDYDFWLKLISLNYEGKLLPEPLFQYRRRVGSRTDLNKAKDENILKTQLRERNPKAYGDPFKSFLPHYQPLLRTQQHDDVDELISQYGLYYQTKLSPSVRYEGMRRANTPTPFIGKHFSSPLTHVLYLIPFMTIGGAEIIDLQILESLRASGKYHVTLLTEFPSANEWKERFSKVADEIFMLHTLTEDIRGPSSVAIVEYLVFSRNVDVVINRNTFVGYRAAKEWEDLYSQIRFIDILHLYEPHVGAWERESFPYHSLMDARVVISDDLANFVSATYSLPRDDFTVIHCGVETDTLNASFVEGALRRKLRIPASAKLVAFVGRLVEQKDPISWIKVTLHEFELTKGRSAYFGGTK